MGTRDGTPAVTEVPLRTVTLTLCVPCLAGEGGECHSPGCALWMSTAPDIPVTQHLTEAEADAAHREWEEFFTRTVGVSPSSDVPLRNHWIVNHRQGWCALPPGAVPDPDACNDPTLCGYVVVLRGGSERGQPDCPECLEMLGHHDASTI